MINRTKVKESTQIKPGDNGDVLVMKDNAPEWSTPSDADLAKASETDTKLAEKQDKLTAGDNIKIEDNVISAASKPTPINIGTVTEGETAMVSNSGTDTDVVLNFVLPKGDKGDAGSQGPQGDPGPKGDPGEPFQIRKIYSSVDEMEADYNNPDIEEGDFVLINTDDISDPDNAKLYVKGPTGWQFVTDLSGAQGIQGPQGDTGAPAGFGNITATVDSTTGTPQVSVQADGPNTAKNISFSFTGLKGEKGDPGEAGTQVNNLAPLMVAAAPTAVSSSVATGDYATAQGNSSVAIGSHADAVNSKCSAIGAFSEARSSAGAGSVAVGYSATAGQEGAALSYGGVAVGDNAEATGNEAIAIGYNALASASNSISIATDQAGSSSSRGAIEQGAVCIGGRLSSGIGSVAIGPGAEATKYGSIALSAGSSSGSATATSQDGIAIGGGSSCEGKESVAIGRGANATASSSASVALGSYSSATEANVVSVGSGGATMALSDDMDEETRARIQARAAVATRRIVNVTDPQSAQDAATKNYVDTKIADIPSGTDINSISPRQVGTAPAIGNSSCVAVGDNAQATAQDSVAIGRNTVANEANTVSVGSASQTRRIVNVTDPQDPQDAATKNYVDTQLTPINAKLQYVPENTNQILSQIQTNVEKAQSAADAKVASITAGTGISVDASNPTAPVVSTTGLATQASVDTLTTTVESKANQTDLDSLEATVANKADTSALANYATKTELAAKADQTAVDAKVSSVTAGEGISITGTATEPVISATGGITDTGWMEITGSSGSGLKYLTGPWTIPVAAKVKIRKFGKRVTVVGIVQATEDISSGAATPLLSIPESDPHFDAFSLPQVSQYDIAHDQQKSAATSVLLIRGMLTSFNVEQDLDTPKINVTLVPVVGIAGQAAQIGNGDTVNFQISWDTED